MESNQKAECTANRFLKERSQRANCRGIGGGVKEGIQCRASGAEYERPNFAWGAHSTGHKSSASISNYACAYCYSCDQRCFLDLWVEFTPDCSYYLVLYIHMFYMQHYLNNRECITVVGIHLVPYIINRF